MGAECRSGRHAILHRTGVLNDKAGMSALWAGTRALTAIALRKHAASCNPMILLCRMVFGKCLARVCKVWNILQL